MTDAESSVPTIWKSSARVAFGQGTLDLHYRVAGSGAPLFLLHPSPLCSAFMEPLMQRLAGRATLIAPDTPGFGESDPIGAQTLGLAPYVNAMIALRRALGLDQVAVYGSATGAQIAIEWAKADPDGVAGVVLDNAASFTDAERDRIMDGYFPDVTPAADGTHLARAWQAAHDATMFFPWQHPVADNRIAVGVAPAEAIDMTAKGYLSAGPGYESAYRAAFRNERAERALPIRVPLVVMRWQGSILRRWTNRFDGHRWGENVVMAHCGPDIVERWSSLEGHLASVLPTCPTSADALRLDTGAIRYADTEFGQIRYRPPPDPLRENTPVRGSIVLASLGTSVNSVMSREFAQDAWLFDLPGHGGGATPDDLGVGSTVRVLGQALQVVGPGRFTLAGAGAAARLTEGIAAGDDRLTAVSTPLFAYRGALPDLAPETSGAHLWRGWHWLRRQFLDRDMAPPNPARLTRRLLDLLDAHRAYRILRPRLESESGLGIER